MTAGDVDFPSDIEWNCEDYQNFPAITDPTPYTGTLSTTGSGIPGGASGNYCPYNYTHSDDTLSVCGGLKLIRTWTVLNWCTTSIVTGPDAEGDDSEQLVKVLDSLAPLIVAQPQLIEATTTGSNPGDCRSMGFVEPAIVTDDCSAFYAKNFFSNRRIGVYKWS